MRLIFGVLSLLVVVAVVMAVAKKQLQAVGVAPATSSGPAAAGTPTPPTVTEGAKQVQQRVADDVNRLMQQAPQRASDAE